MVDSGQGQRARNIRRGLRRAGAGILLLLAGMLLGGLASSGPLEVLSVTTGFLGLVGGVGRALALWNVDAFVFEDFSEGLVGIRRSRPPGRRRSRSDRHGREMDRALRV